MIKKRLLLCLSVILIFLTGCTGYTESDSRYIVSALGFEKSGDSIILNIQTVTANEGKEEIAQKTYKASGKSPEEARSLLEAKLSKPLSFEHCSVVALSPELSAQEILKICEFCKDLERLNTSVYFAVCKDIGDLLDCEAVSGSAGGYDISSLIESRAETQGISYKNRLYEILSAREDFSPTFNLPIISVSQDEFYIDGEYIYTDFVPIKKLNNEESLIYSLITNKNEGGFWTVEDKTAKINSSHTYLSSELKDNILYISLYADINFKEKSPSLEKALSIKAKELLQAKTDIFDFANIIKQKQAKVFEQIKGDYKRAFENCVIEFKVKEG